MIDFIHRLEKEFNTKIIHSSKCHFKRRRKRNPCMVGDFDSIRSLERYWI